LSAVNATMPGHVRCSADADALANVVAAAPAIRPSHSFRPTLITSSRMWIESAERDTPTIASAVQSEFYRPYGQFVILISRVPPASAGTLTISSLRWQTGTGIGSGAKPAVPG